MIKLCACKAHIPVLHEICLLAKVMLCSDVISLSVLLIISQSYLQVSCSCCAVHEHLFEKCRTSQMNWQQEEKKNILWESTCENCQGELWQLTKTVSWLGEGIAGVWDNVLLSFLGPLQFLIEHLLHGGALWGRIVAGFCKVCALSSNQAVNQYIWQGT